MKLLQKLMTILFIFLFSCENKKVEAYRIGIVQLIEHPDVEKLTEGIKSVLKDNDSIKYEIIVRNAQGQPNALSQIFNELKTHDINLIVPIFTPTAQAATKEFKDIPIVFSAVTDPVGAGIVKSLENSGNNVTGVSDLFPIDKQLKLIKQIIPNAKKVGVLYNPGEQNSSVTYNLIEAEATKLGLEIIPAGVANSNEILIACNILKKDVDVIFTSNDITVAAGLDAIVKFSWENKIPFFAGDPTAVEKGAIGTYSQSYYSIGKSTGYLIKQIESGKKPYEIPVLISKSAKLYLNVQSASKMGVSIPAAIIDSLNLRVE